MKSFFDEFKKFILRGNVIDLAVGVIIGGAFQAIIKSLVDDVISPVIGLFANTDLSGMVAKVGDVEIRWGAFVTAIINFIIMAFVIFLIVRTINKVVEKTKKKEEEEAPKTKICPRCRSEIDIEATRCPHCTSEL
ncbi:MAG: large conductance mechanosensitive channel protein MscL [Lachnospiraceae bacterium]|nr:large conductance mechanosensitive channel protein MscL [Lachnospiraceae bacterium]